MATYNDIKFDPYKPPQNFSLEKCDVCGSPRIAETREGYVCKECGVVLEIQKLEYHAPYEPAQLQHAVMDKTQMGFWKERRVMSDSVRAERLSKLDAIRESEIMVKRSARVEIKRLLTGLQFPLQDVSIILKKFTEVRNQLGKGTKFRAPEKLVPCVLYFYYKGINRPIRENKLLELTSLSKKEFNSFKLQLLEMWPKYQERDRQEYIMQRILGLCEHFELGMNFFHQTKKILYRFYDSIKNTKDDVIVGLVSSITLLCSNNDEIHVSSICKHLNIKMSTIQSQVQRRIFKQFNIGGYISLIRSKDMLKRIMIKLDILDPLLTEFEVEPESEEKTQISERMYRALSLGSASPIFTFYDNDEYYSILFETKKELLVALVGKPNNSVSKKLCEREGEQKDQREPVHLELWRFQYPTGPPLAVV
jgi:uncharacterized Zn finger protein (UPF0148 family)